MRFLTIDEINTYFDTLTPALGQVVDLKAQSFFCFPSFSDNYLVDLQDYSDFALLDVLFLNPTNQLVFKLFISNLSQAKFQQAFIGLPNIIFKVDPNNSNIYYLILNGTDQPQTDLSTIVSLLISNSSVEKVG